MVVFQPLMECYVNLRERGTAINIHLTETWWRHYQVGTTSLNERAKEIAKFVRHNEVVISKFFSIYCPITGAKMTEFPLYQ